MANDRKIECKIKPKQDHLLTERQRREISENVRNICFAYDLEYIIVINNKYR